MTRSRPIVFWASHERPSFVMRGHQIGEALRARGHDVQFRLGRFRALSDVQGSIIVCVKRQPWFLGDPGKRGNVVVFDAIDPHWIRGIPRGTRAIICGSLDAQRRTQARVNQAMKVVTIYHHADPNLQQHHAGRERLSLAYVGEAHNSKYLAGEIPQVQVVSFQVPGWRDTIRNFNAHFSARLDRDKSVIKLSNAAIMDAVFLTGREPGCAELLGEDYPFFLRSHEDLALVREDIARLADSIRSRIWDDALDRLRAAREQLTLQASVTAYEKLFAEL